MSTTTLEKKLAKHHHNHTKGENLSAKAEHKREVKEFARQRDAKNAQAGTQHKKR